MTKSDDATKEHTLPDRVELPLVVIGASQKNTDFACVSSRSEDSGVTDSGGQYHSKGAEYVPFSSLITAYSKRRSGNIKQTLDCPVCGRRFGLFVEQRQVLLLPAKKMMTDQRFRDCVARRVTARILRFDRLLMWGLLFFGVGLVYAMTSMQFNPAFLVGSTIWTAFVLFFGLSWGADTRKKIKALASSTSDVLLDQRLLTGCEVPVPEWAELTHFITRIQIPLSQKSHPLRFDRVSVDATTEELFTDTETRYISTGADVWKPFIDFDEPAAPQYINFFSRRFNDLEPSFLEDDKIRFGEAKRAVLFTLSLALVVSSFDIFPSKNSPEFLLSVSDWFGLPALYLFLVLAGVPPVYATLRYFNGDHIGVGLLGLTYSLAVWWVSYSTELTTPHELLNLIYSGIFWPALIIVAVLGGVEIHRSLDGRSRVSPALIRSWHNKS